MSVDAQRVTDVLPYINILWSGPFQIGVALYFLHATMGWVIYAGLGVMLLFTPLNILMTRSINKYQVLEGILLFEKLYQILISANYVLFFGKLCAKNLEVGVNYVNCARIFNV